MSTLLVIVFVFGYAAIAFEHSIGVNKAGAAVVVGCCGYFFYRMVLSILNRESEDSR